MFWHIFKYRLKTLLKNKALIFWTLVFPIVLGTFFYIAFSSINENESFEAFSIAVIDNENYQNNTEFKNIVESLSNDDENQVFITQYVNLDEALDLLDSNEITGYIVVNDEIEIVVKNNGTNETIMKYVIDSYYQMSSVAVKAIEYNPEVIYNGVLNILSSDASYLNDVTNDKIDNIVIYFYTLIGMVCLYGGFFGIYAVSESEANLSKKGARISIAPIHKATKLIASLLASFLVQFSMVLILFAYLTLILKVDFGDQLLPVIFISFCGCLCGLSLGCVVASSNKVSENSKVGILLSITMVFSFLAGMMMQQMKYIVSTYVPLLGYINPVNLITDGLYSLYYYDGYTRYFNNIGLLLLITCVLLTISYFFMRRKKYDSI